MTPPVTADHATDAAEALAMVRAAAQLALELEPATATDLKASNRLQALWACLHRAEHLLTEP